MLIQWGARSAVEVNGVGSQSWSLSECGKMERTQDQTVELRLCDGWINVCQ